MGAVDPRVLSSVYKTIVPLYFIVSIYFVSNTYKSERDFEYQSEKAVPFWKNQSIYIPPVEFVNVLLVWMLNAISLYSPTLIDWSGIEVAILRNILETIA